MRDISLSMSQMQSYAEKFKPQKKLCHRREKILQWQRAAKVMARISLVVFIFLYYTLILSFQYLVSKFNSYAFRCVYQTAVGSHEVLLAHCLFQRDAHDVGMVVGYHLSEAAFHDEFHGADAELGG